MNVFRDIATVMVRSEPFVEYLHLARFGDNWLIVNALYATATDYDDSLVALKVRTGTELDLGKADHRTALPTWLRQWGCRHLNLASEATSAAALDVWAPGSLPSRAALPSPSSHSFLEVMDMKKLWFLPNSPRVLELLCAQAATTVAGVTAFVAWSEGDLTQEATVREAEKTADLQRRELSQDLR